MAALEKSCWLNDWYVLDEYDSAQPEGTADEWRAILAAIKSGESKSFRRVAVRCESGYATLVSPRNSLVDAECILFPGEVDEFVAQAEALLDVEQGMLADGSGI